MAKSFKIPKNLAACADLLYQVKQERLAKDKEAKELKDRETAIKEYLINSLKKGEANGIQGKICRVAVIPKDKPTVEDWDKFYAYVHKNKAYELLQRRLSDTAIQERWENKKVVPGVGTFKVMTVSMNKV